MIFTHDFSVESGLHLVVTTALSPGQFLAVRPFAMLLVASFFMLEPEAPGRQTRGSAKYVVEILRRVEPGLGGYARR